MHTRAAVLEEPGEVAVKEFELPELDTDEVLLEVKSCGICTTDRRMYAGDLKVPFPVIGGHEIAGDIVDLGGEVDDINVGDRATLDKINRCGHCYFCTRGMDNLCVNSKKANKLDNVFLIAGGFSKYIIAKRKQVFTSSNEPDYNSLALTEPLACSLHSIKKASPEPGDTALIIGGGTMGILHGTLAKNFGATPIISEPDPEREKFASQKGFEVIKPEDVDAVSKEINRGLGFDSVFVTAPSATAINQSLNYLRKMGTLVIYTSLHPSQELSFDSNEIHYTEKTVTGTEGRTMEDFREATELLSQSTVELGSLATKNVKLSELSEEFSLTPQGSDQRTIVKP